jgi:hypothetical protein
VLPELLELLGQPEATVVLRQPAITTIIIMALAEAVALAEVVVLADPEHLRKVFKFLPAVDLGL